MAEESRRYLVIVSLSNTTPLRLQNLVPQLQDLLRGLSTEPIEQVFRSVNADVFGYLLRSKLVAGQVRAAIETPQRDSSTTAPIVEPVLEGGDNVLVVEVGKDFSGSQGFSRQQTWLQRH